MLLGATTAACGAVVWLTPAASPERVLGALLLGLVLPGTALSRLLSWEDRYRAVGRLLLVPALSLAVVIIASLLLYLAGIHLDAHSWTISVGGVALAASALGPLRAVPLPRFQPTRLEAGRLLSLTAVAVAVLFAGAVFLTIRGVRAQAQADHFTQLWILPSAGNERAATIGVLNHEAVPKSYRVEVYMNQSVESFQTIRLRPGDRWTTPVNFTPQARTVRVTLALAGSPGVVYRQVHLRLAPTSTPLASTPSVSNSVP
ncbi:MAG TPA: DUF1616 domain-containing protein [Solirubrobacteraceae bacterium]|jgi:uncharacterized membrane protein